MKLRELIEYCENYINDGIDPETEVVVCDDGMKARFFPIDIMCGTKIGTKNDNGTYDYKNVLILTTDLYNEIK